MKTFLLAAAAALALTLQPAMARNNGGSEFSSFEGFGSFATAGQAGAVSAFGGQAESFASGSAGLTFSRCSTCGGASFSGWQDNQAGALTQGLALSWGVSQGAAQGAAFGGFASRR